MSHEEAEYGLVMPFVVCTDQGGPYETSAFVAGIYCGGIDQQLKQNVALLERYVPSPLVPQLDLMAMKEGYTMTAEPWDEHPDEWTLVTFVLLSLDQNNE